MNKPQDISAKTNKPDTPALNPKQTIKLSSCQALSGNGEIGYELNLDNKRSLLRITLALINAVIFFFNNSK